MRTQFPSKRNFFEIKAWQEIVSLVL
jgi:hypothetical protein